MGLGQDSKSIFYRKFSKCQKPAQVPAFGVSFRFLLFYDKLTGNYLCLCGDFEVIDSLCPVFDI